jgi:hypothetical protein
MELERERTRRFFGREHANSPAGLRPAGERPVVGKRTLTELLPAVIAPVQCKLAVRSPNPTGPRRAISELFGGVQRAALAGVTGGGQPLPHLAQLQAAFGAAHDLSGVRAHIGGAAAASCEAIGAEAYAVGDQVAFHDAPGLHVAAHEAAHVVQQRRGVSLYGGVGAADLLAAGPGGAGGPAVQRKITIEGDTEADDKNYESYEEIPKNFRTLFENAKVPSDILSKFTDEIEARAKFVEAIKRWANGEQYSPIFRDKLILEHAWREFGNELAAQEAPHEPLLDEGPSDDDIRRDLLAVDRDLQQLTQLLDRMPEERLMRIAGLAKGKIEETRNFYLVERRDVSAALAEVCAKYADKLRASDAENNTKPNHLLESNMFPAIQEAGNYILDKYPPQTHAYIGLGASPAPLTKYLELSKRRNGEIEVYDLPLSGLTAVCGTIKDSWETNAQEKANLTAFIDTYLSAFASPEKRVIVIDYSTGGSLFSAEYIIGQYLKEKRPGFDPAQIIPLSITEQGQGSYKGTKPTGKSQITDFDLHSKTFRTLVKDLDAAWFKLLGYRDTDKNHAKDIMAGTHVTHHLIGGYERLIRDLRALMTD